MTESFDRPTVACVVITKNEERNIADCLKSVQWANELIVVDAVSFSNSDPFVENVVMDLRITVYLREGA